ncbi:hypothetical protein ACVGVM_02755 [Pseudonocardia bannensis]|uniref:Uncharacterized protein n=1 Tax=Pseudonocardia bannensis TaxID=630973 RepID=A0A848DKS6_9PSEU|nr:hypothetical protein [Pseudonocardia bannensis]NMH93298.1 hypothetical protein [Pseudonocardia bannensis]
MARTWFPRLRACAIGTRRVGRVRHGWLAPVGPGRAMAVAECWAAQS